ncbi:hypothetical protein [Methanobrevibacter olleyae]|uniref:hypothetical protein n=1 Tax=Methanobrevibacter olleyae TaxID=294671 RepID=UPI000AD2F6D5|nr:hypothetical protein [Methanobrevibacter olleyae]
MLDVLFVALIIVVKYGFFTDRILVFKEIGRTCVKVQRYIFVKRCDKNIFKRI